MLASVMACHRSSAPSTVIRPFQSSFQIARFSITKSLEPVLGGKGGKATCLFVGLGV